MSMFQICNQIGSGHFGKVYKAKFVPSEAFIIQHTAADFKKTSNKL